MRRVAITGWGSFSDRFHSRHVLAALQAGECGIRDITSFDTSLLKIKRGAEVSGFDALRNVRREGIEMARSIRASTV